jgi:hypothetical protein
MWYACILVVLVFELRASHLLGSCSITYAMSLALFALHIFHIGSLIFARGRPCKIPLPMPPV